MKAPQAKLAELAVLIPAWKPEESLVSIVETMVNSGFASIILVDDGSPPEFAPIFKCAGSLPRVHLLQHAVNLGKGRALKTGINFFLNDLPECAGLLTADADGQHRPEDIVKVALSLDPTNSRISLGSRGFTKGVPLRSRFGNLLTRRIFRLITGVTLADTQTGLRGFPRSLLPELMLLTGEGYEYEMTVLVHLCGKHERPIEVPIETVYLEGNPSSHFDPIRDSMRIYFVLARFYLSSILAAGVDLAGFSLAFALTHHVLFSVIFGRLSSLLNFALNRQFVFRGKGSLKGMLARYYVLVAAIAGMSYVLIRALTSYGRWNVFAAKITVDVLLSLVSFSAQRTFVFRRRSSD